MTNFNLAEINDRILKESAFIDDLRQAMAQKIVGQEEVVSKIFIGLLANGHILLEGVPGLAKTLMANTISQLINVKLLSTKLETSFIS